jgi:hypothetical protein
MKHPVEKRAGWAQTVRRRALMHHGAYPSAASVCKWAVWWTLLPSSFLVSVVVQHSGASKKRLQPKNKKIKSKKEKKGTLGSSPFFLPLIGDGLYGRSFPPHQRHMVRSFIHSSSSFLSDIVFLWEPPPTPPRRSDCICFVVVVCMKISRFSKEFFDWPTELPVPLPTHALYIYNIVLLYSVDGENRKGYFPKGFFFQEVFHQSGILWKKTVINYVIT